MSRPGRGSADASPTADAASGGALDQLEYWRQQLQDAPVLDLPLDKPRPAVLSRRGATVAVPIPAPTVELLESFCARRGVTPFMVMLAALDALLARYSGATDVSVGRPVASREDSMGDLIGSFGDTIVMRVSLEGRPSFDELLERVLTVTLEACANQDVPFASVVDALHLGRDRSRAPLFQVQLAVKSTPTTPGFGELDAGPFHVERGSTRCDLAIEMDLSGPGELTIEYATDLFAADRIDRFAGHLFELLSAALAAPDRPVDELSIMSPAERAALEQLWAGPVLPQQDFVAVPLQIERRSADEPDRLAVRHRGRELTYGALNARANQLARHLADVGVTRGELVGIHLHRSIETVVAVLATLKVGAAYVPLDPTYPAERLSYMRDDSGVRVVLSHSELADAALDAPVTVLLDREDDRIARQETTDLGVPLTQGELAYVIYTSGTTGRPKGVEVEHGSLANFIAAMALGPAVGPEDVVLFASALSFDISVLEIFHTLVHGARLVVADRETMLDGVRLAELIRTAGVTLMQATPITWRALIESGWEGEPRLTALCGGEAMSPQLARELGRRCSALWNVYGPTETTVWSTMQQIDPERDAASGTVPIGRPVANTLCYVLDARLQPVPIGVPGELFIGGQGTARGYHDRAELTAERFLPDPFVPDSRARMYRTGDICRLRADGNLEHLGRADHQVKVRGQRIELGEIEANLLAHAKVRSAVVTTYETTPGDAHLAAYYLAEGDAVLDAGELRDHLRRRLPAGLVPAVFVHLLEFPRTPSNKIDRKRLPLPTTTQADAAGPARPASDLERQLVAIWSNVLGGQQVGVDDDFFELGGHSLLATRITSAISASTGRRIPLSALFEAPTVRRLAAYIETDRPDGRWTSLVPMQPHGERPPFFYVAPYLITILSFAHLARHLEPDQPFYVLQPQGMDGDHPAHESIEEMATHYIAEMRQVQPSGPYRIGGLCAGSWVAFEMACQLQEAGEEVAALVVVDSEPPNIDPPRLNPVTHAVNRLRRYREDGKVLDSVRWQLQLFTDRYLRRYVGASDGRRVARLRRTHADAHRGYRGRTFHGDLVLVRSEDWAARPEKAWHVRWDELITGGLELDTVPGTHGDLSETESSASVARIIRRTVDRATNVALVAPLVLGTAIVGSDCLAGLSALAV